MSCGEKWAGLCVYAKRSDCFDTLIRARSQERRWWRMCFGIVCPILAPSSVAQPREKRSEGHRRSITFRKSFRSPGLRVQSWRSRMNRMQVFGTEANCCRHYKSFVRMLIWPDCRCVRFYRWMMLNSRRIGEVCLGQLANLEAKGRSANWSNEARLWGRSLIFHRFSSTYMLFVA